MKVDDYSFRGLPQDVIDFKDQVTSIMNNGKYAAQVVSTAPTWKARNGENVFYFAGGVTRWYFYTNSTWQFVEFGNQQLRGWINFDGATPVINDSYNVTSLTRNGAGNYTIGWTVAWANTNYTISGVASENTSAKDPMIVGVSSLTVSATQVLTHKHENSILDGNPCAFMAAGDQ